MINARMARPRRGGSAASRPIWKIPNVWQELTGEKKPKNRRRSREKPRAVVDVYRGDKHVQEIVVDVYRGDKHVQESLRCGSAAACGATRAAAGVPGADGSAARARHRAGRRPRRAAALPAATSRKVAIAEPKIADAVVISPREVMVNAKGPGRTTLVIWETGAEPARYEVEVTKDTIEWDSFTKAHHR